MASQRGAPIWPKVGHGLMTLSKRKVPERRSKRPRAGPDGISTQAAAGIAKLGLGDKHLGRALFVRQKWTNRLGLWRQPKG